MILLFLSFVDLFIPLSNLSAPWGVYNEMVALEGDQQLGGFPLHGISPVQPSPQLWLSEPWQCELQALPKGLRHAGNNQQSSGIEPQT